jgi:hypothetical protein
MSAGLLGFGTANIIYRLRSDSLAIIPILVRPETRPLAPLVPQSVDPSTISGRIAGTGSSLVMFEKIAFAQSSDSTRRQRSRSFELGIAVQELRARDR